MQDNGHSVRDVSEDSTHSNKNRKRSSTHRPTSYDQQAVVQDIQDEAMLYNH